MSVIAKPRQREGADELKALTPWGGEGCRGENTKKNALYTCRPEACIPAVPKMRTIS